jgi:hypothetical protein
MDFLFALLQTISAIVVFVVGYLALLVSVVICFAIATCVYRGGCLAWAYTVKSASLDHGVVSKVASDKDSASRLGGRHGLAPNTGSARAVNRYSV